MPSKSVSLDQPAELNHAYRSGKWTCGLSGKRLQALISCQIRQIKDLDISFKKAHRFCNRHTIQSPD
jgi:hypothetical protein